MQTDSFILDDFSGGITDRYIDAQVNQYQYADNFLIDENRKLELISGSEVYDLDKPAPANRINTRTGTIFDLSGTIFLHYDTSIYYEDGITWTELQGPNGEEALTDVIPPVDSINNLADENSALSTAYWNNHVFVTTDEYTPVLKIYRDGPDDGSGTFQVRTAGLPLIQFVPVITPTDPATPEDGVSYLYAFVYKYSYTVDGVTFEDRGPVYFHPDQVSHAFNVNPTVDGTPGDPGVTIIGISGIEDLSNDLSANPAILTHYNWDVENIELEVYRTAGNGSTFNWVHSFAYGDTEWHDDVTDSIRDNTLSLYTDAGVLDNSLPPLAKAMHVANNVGWYGNVRQLVGTVAANGTVSYDYINYPYRVMQSKIYDPDSVPETHYVDTEDIVVAISSYLDRVLVLGKNSVTRLDGVFDDAGSNGIEFQKISDVIGCVSAKSVVQTPGGVFFASQEGFAYTDGFTVTKISGSFDTRYKALVATEERKKRIYGEFDKVEGRVWWSVQEGDGVSDTDSCYILDLKFPISAHSVFTAATGMDSFAPTALYFKDGDLIRGDRRGYILKHSSDLHSFPSIDTTVSARDWYTEAIQYRYRSIATSFGDTKFRKFNPRVIFRAENASNLSVEIKSIADLNNRIKTLPPIIVSGNFIWGSPTFVWGSSSFIWGDGGMIEEMRRFHGNDMRCSYRQLEIGNAYIDIHASDDLSTANVVAANNTVVLTGAADEWPEDIAGYDIFFANDGYEQGFRILSASGDTAVVEQGAGGPGELSDMAWEIKGYPKNEILRLLNLTMQFAPLGQTQTDYTPSILGGNA